MRSIYITFLVLITSALLMSIPLPVNAFQSSPFVQFLVSRVCSGQTASYKSGCNGYLHKRITQYKPPETALTECTNLCDYWYGSEPSKKEQCIQGCRFLNSKE